MLESIKPEYVTLFTRDYWKSGNYDNDILLLLRHETRDTRHEIIVTYMCTVRAVVPFFLGPVGSLRLLHVGVSVFGARADGVVIVSSTPRRAACG